MNLIDFWNELEKTRKNTEAGLILADEIIKRNDIDLVSIDDLNYGDWFYFPEGMGYFMKIKDSCSDAVNAKGHTCNFNKKDQLVFIPRLIEGV